MLKILHKDTSINTNHESNFLIFYLEDVSIYKSIYFCHIAKLLFHFPEKVTKVTLLHCFLIVTFSFERPLSLCML